MKKFTWFIYFFLIAGVIITSIPNRSYAVQLFSDHRLVFMEYPSSVIKFDPNQDMLHPTSKQERLEKLKETITRITLESLFPLLPNIKAALTGKETDIYQAAMTMVSLVYKELQEPIKNAIKEDSDLLPIMQDAYLVPFYEEMNDLFYSAGKISMSGLEQANVLGASVSNNKFAKVVTANIQKLQEKYKGSHNPVSLLASRRFLYLSTEESTLTYTLLFRVKPRKEEFKQENDEVRFENLVIPGSDDDEPVVARIIIKADLSTNTPPMLTVEFGEFKAFELDEASVVANTPDNKKEREKYEAFTFTFKKGKRYLAIPRLEGVKKGLREIIQVRTGFEKVEFNLNTLSVSGIDMLLQPGLGIGGMVSFIPIAINKGDVDEQFQSEINTTIKAERQKLNEKLASLFSAIMGSKKETK